MTFLVRVKDNEGRWFPAETYDDILQARARETELEIQKKRGAHALGDDAKKVTFDEYWEVWSSENRSSVSEGWKMSQNQMYKDYIKPVIGHLKMISITAPEIGKLMNRAQEKGLGPQTRKHIYSLVNKMFTDSVEYYEMLVVSPVKPKFHRPSVPLVKRAFLTPTEAHRLLEYSKDHYLGPAIWLGLLSALRVSEKQALKGKSLLYDLNQILICEIWNNKTKRIQPYPKQLDWTYVPMPPKLKEYLLNLNRGPNDFVVQSKTGEMLSYNTYVIALKRLCKDAGVREITPHELRHSSTEIYIQAGASTEDIRRLLNHNGLTATRRYIHRTDERLSSIAEKLTHESFTKNFTNVKKQAYLDTEREQDNVH